jgi:hypothetical protein
LHLRAGGHLPPGGEHLVGETVFADYEIQLGTPVILKSLCERLAGERALVHLKTLKTGSKQFRPYFVRRAQAVVQIENDGLYHIDEMAIIP